MKRRWLLIVVVVAAVIVGGMVVVGNVAVAHSNPPVTQTIPWDSPETEQLVRTACYDCHSNETEWPWYSFVAPVSMLVANDVTEGREAMNFSTDRRFEGDEMVEKIREGEMPPSIYTVMHPSANLTDDQRTALIAGIEATFGG